MAYLKLQGGSPHTSLSSIFTKPFKEYGINIIKEFSHDKQIFAETRPNKDKLNSLVKILILWENENERRFIVEIRSSEPQLKGNTYCQEVANKIQKIIESIEIN